ncbi:MAG: hypothetical protein LBB45_05280 [Methanobrevibacter sp.]|jgi:hypothetical protein|nr:hypothetical protein [Candidatus Methanovirga basalitermitum]
MGKKFDVIMAGVISGIVAITTTFLGLAGTIIGTVLGSIIYQSLSTYIKESFSQVSDSNRLKINNLQLFENKIVFIIPIILIIIIEISFLSSIIYNSSTFSHLENLTNNNLFRAIGIGLFIIGLYSIFQPRKIKHSYGITLFTLSIFFLIRGSIDAEIVYIPQMMYAVYFLLDNDLEIAILIIFILGYITIKLFYDSLKLYIYYNSKIDNLADENKKVNENKNSENCPKIINSYHSKKDNSVNVSKNEKDMIEGILKRSKKLK